MYAVRYTMDRRLKRNNYWISYVGFEKNSYEFGGNCHAS